MSLYAETMPDNKKRVALLYGPIVLAGQLGEKMPDPVYGTPVLLTDNYSVTNWAKPIANEPLVFQLEHVGKPMDVQLIPFYKTYSQYYNVYWDYFNNAEWLNRQAAYEVQKKHEQEIEERTIDIMRLGEMQPERDHHLTASENSYVDGALGKMGREARKNGFFAFDMKVRPGTMNILMCEYLGDDKNRTFDILIDGQKIAEENLNGGDTGKFFEKEYPIPNDLIKGKTIVIVRIQANDHSTAGRIFGCRILKSDKNNLN
jgi:hypothetical protein